MSCPSAILHSIRCCLTLGVNRNGHEPPNCSLMNQLLYIYQNQCIVGDVFVTVYVSWCCSSFHVAAACLQYFMSTQVSGCKTAPCVRLHSKGLQI